MSADNLLLLDANSLINRAFYGLYGRHNLTAPDGTPTGALFAFCNMYLKLLEEIKPTHVAAAFDRREPTFRHERYTPYKGTRKPMPDDLAVQIPLLKELLAAWGVPCLEMPGYEADDLIGTLSVTGGQHMPVTIVSGDKDTFQLASDNVTILQPVTRSGRTETERYDVAAIRERFQMSPAQFIDMKALMGDPSDNIPGVRGIGEKTAVDLISRYGDLEGVYAALDEIRPAVAGKLAEHRDMAFLSRELATICLTVPLETTLADLRLHGFDRESLSALLVRLGFKTLLERLAIVPAVPDRAAGTMAKPAEAADLDMLRRDARQAGQEPLALLLDAGRPFCWSTSTGPVRYLAGADAARTGLESVCHILAQEYASCVCFDYKRWLRDNNLPDLIESVHDVLVAAYLLNQLDGRPDLERIYQQATGDVLQLAGRPAEQAAVPGSKRPVPVQTNLFDQLDQPEQPDHPDASDPSGIVSSASVRSGQELPPADQDDAERLAALLRISASQQQAIEARGITFLARDVEFPLTGILAAMEQRGFALDLAMLETLSNEMGDRLDQLKTEIYRMCGKTFNINSPKQLGEVLFRDLGLTAGKRRAGGAWATDSDELDRLSGEHPVIPLIVTYRQTAKLKATFVEGLMKMIGPDGRVRTTFNQTLTATGRLSSSDPNLQNIPIRMEEGRKIRQAFVAAPGHVLIDADYSQIELRLLAHLSQDPAMVEAFNTAQDIHTNTAVRLFGKPAESITPDMRAIAKTMNFSIVYGISDFGLARDLGIPVRQAHHLIQEYEAQYPNVRAYLDSLARQAKESGYVETLFGRRRYLPELKSSNRTVRQFGERAAMNAPIQGTAADLVKIAMVRADRALKEAGLSARLILQVHDELIVEAPEDEADAAAQILTREMQSAVQLRVPLIADVASGRTWAACKGQDNNSLPDNTAHDRLPDNAANGEGR